jgi:DNA-binding transcriptional LysR family regulator
VPASPRDLTDMLIFARVVEAMSFTAAARRLEVSKSVVSARVGALEERLGTRLLHRTTRRLTLTPDGVRFYDRCARVTAEADEAVSVSEGDVVRGLVRVTAPEGFSQRHLVGAFAAFIEAHPDIRLELAPTDRLVDLVGEGFDLAVRISARLSDSSLVARRLASDRMVLAASPAYLARRGEPRDPGELVQHTCLRYARLKAREEWAFEGLAVSVDGPLAASSGTLLREAALAGLGIAVLPESEIGEELAAGRLATVLDGTLRGAALGVFALHAARPPARVRAVVDHLVAWFATPRWASPATGRRRRSRPPAK